MVSSAIWAIAVVVFFVVEAMTTALVTIWFAIGALLALLVSFFCQNILIQISVFLVISIATLFACYPIIREGREPQFKTNLDSMYGKECIVIEKIDNLHATGKIQISGQIWTARSAEDSVIEKNALVVVKRIEGVKMIVTKVSKTNAEDSDLYSEK